MKLPSDKILKENKFFKKHYHHIERRPHLFNLDKNSLARGSAIGGFSALLPIPFQMFIATPLCILFKGNLPIAISLVWVSNPITMPFIMYGQYILGAWILNSEFDHNADIMDIVSNSFYPLLLGSIITSFLVGFLFYLFFKVLGRWVIRQ